MSLTKIKYQIKRSIAILSIVILTFGNPAIALSQEAPTPPSTPTAPTAPTAPPPPEQPSPPPAPTSTPEPTQAPDPTPAPPSPTPTLTPTDTPTPTPVQTNTPTPTSTPPSTNGQTGDTAVITGDATNTSTVVTVANSNQASSPAAPESVSGSTSSLNDNGSTSNNTISDSSDSTSSTIQDNTASAISNFEQTSLTGDNSASQNLGTSYISTGDANTSATAITAVNTNVDSVGVKEFNIVDNHTGDLILDFSDVCFGQSCSPSANTSSTTGNGSGSDNNTASTTTADQTSFQNNTAAIGIDMDLSANSGDNTASLNTGGDSVIKTGDANVGANVINFANNNIEGAVLFGVVNIYGDLYGDIILPESAFASAPSPNSSATTIADNGSDSNNNTSQTSNSNTESVQTNTADITTNINIDGQTGDNEASMNTGGDSVIKTGEANASTEVVNVTNTNTQSEENMWLVIINKAGQWIGKVFGGGDASTIAYGSPTAEITVNPDTGETNVTGNGSDSNNSSTETSNSNSSTNQQNSADIVNNLNLSANTGGNETSNNTGGDSYIETGDANIIANIINFANNNIVGDSTLVVALINVFGNWFGDFLPPGTTKPPTDTDNETAPTPIPTQAPELADETGRGGVEEEAPPTTTTATDTNSNGATATAPKPTSRPAWWRLTPQVAQSIAGPVEEVAAADPNPIGQVLADTAAAQKSIDINLAWGLFLIPLALLIRYARRLFAA